MLRLHFIVIGNFFLLTGALQWMHVVIGLSVDSIILACGQLYQIDFKFQLNQVNATFITFRKHQRVQEVCHENNRCQR